MIVAHIFEGLGNQLFQYAMGRAVSERAGVPLAIETDWFDTDQGGAGRQSERRRCQLDAFHIEAPRVTRRQLAFHHASATPLGRAVDKLLRLGSGRMAKQVHERGMQFQPEKLDVGPEAPWSPSTSAAATSCPSWSTASSAATTAPPPRHRSSEPPWPPSPPTAGSSS
jgi:hypothetical protein